MTCAHTSTSIRIMKRMVDLGADACFMKDKHGYLPAHVACRNHTSVDNLRLLLAVNPAAVNCKTEDDHNLLDLALHYKNDKYSNCALIKELHV
jgi:Ankyrin repeats (many copies)